MPRSKSLPESATPSFKQATKSAAWFAIAAFLTNALGFITIPLFTRIMTPEEFGRFSAIAAIQIVLVTLFGLEGHLTINRARFDFIEEEFKSYQFSVLVLGIIFTAALLCAFMVVPGFFEDLTDLHRKYILIMLIYLLFQPSFNMFQAFQRVQYRYKLSVGISVSIAVFATSLSIYLVTTLSDALLGRVAGFYLPFAALGAGLFAYHWYQGKRVRLRYWGYALKLGIPLVIATLGTQGMLVGSRIVVQQIGDPSSLAFLSLALSIANIALILVMVLDRAWSPWLMDCLHADDIASAMKMFVPYLGFVTILTASISFLAPEVVLLLGGETYIAAVAIVPSILLGTLLGMIAKQYVFVQTFHRRVELGGLATIICTAINVTLCALFVETWGIESVGYINIVTYLLLIFAQKLVLKFYGLRDPFPLKVLSPFIGLGLALLPLQYYFISLENRAIRILAVGFLLLAAVVSLIALKRSRANVQGATQVT